MIEVICSLIAATSAVAVAFIGRKYAKDQKKIEARAEARARESRLSMNFMAANAKLCVGTALAIKRGHCNGELDAGLEAVAKAEEGYEEFLRETTADRIA